jgi:hypothetical protein
MDQWNVCIYINSIIYAITLPSSLVFTLFRLLPHIAIGFVLDVDIFVVCFLAMFSWYAADSYLAVIIWSAALKRLELIYYLIPFHGFSFNHFFNVYGKNNW